MVVKFPKEHKDQVIQEIQTFFETERDEQIGNLCAEAILDFF